MIDQQVYFGPGLFQFLRDLATNNDRTWFQANRHRYEAEVKEPLLRFIADFDLPLREISTCFAVDPRPVGGSMFRIYRDTRFAKDKSPYKTHAAAHFRHESASHDVHAPGFYLHLEPGRCLAGGGSWHPHPEALARIRRAIVDDPAGWLAATADNPLADGEAVKRPPAGFDPDHPLIEDLKRKDFFSMRSFSDAQVCGERFLLDYAAACRGMSPLVRFLTHAAGLGW